MSRFNLLPWTGERIASNGVYDLPIRAYHSDCCVGPSISSSGLRTIEGESPLHYWFDSYLNPDREPPEEKDSWDLGRAVHTLMLGEKGFRDLYAIRPEKWSAWTTDASKAWRAEQKENGRTVLVPNDIDKIKGIARSLERHPLIQSGLLAGEVERSLIWQDKETGVWLKARPDALPTDGATLVDLKTCASADFHSVQRSTADFGYAMQMALGGIGMKQVLGIDIENDGYVLVFVETKAPYAINIKPIDAEDIMLARGQIRRALRKFAECWAAKDWPGYPDDTFTMSLPAWQRNPLKAEFDAGRLNPE